MTVFVFPGQGSQVKGMGKDLFPKYPQLVQQANSILGYDVERLCLEDPFQQLDNTQYTQPALFTVSALAYLDQISTNSNLPNYVAGHSLGEYNALFASKAIDFTTGLKLVQKRGALMAQARNGGMAAVIGFNENELRDILHDKQLNNVDIANLNTKTQIVISGLKENIEAAKTALEAAGARMVIPLKVSGAFHSRYMQNAADEFAQFIRQFTFNAPEINIISNVEARPMDASTIQNLLIKQITNSVNWAGSIQYLLDKGESEFIELGSGRVLTGLIATIKRGV
jgi:malonyl CoA-acyl carrier protein transacylase